MLLIIAGIVVLGMIAATVGYLGERHRKKSPHGGSETSETIASPPAECCGQHEICERESLLAAVSKKIEYYDDEELDEYQGVASNEYPENAVDEFREVLYTLRETEVAGWLRSLQLRGLHLPDQLKDEAFLIVGEKRN